MLFGRFVGVVGGRSRVWGRHRRSRHMKSQRSYLRRLCMSHRIDFRCFRSCHRRCRHSVLVGPAVGGAVAADSRANHEDPHYEDHVTLLHIDFLPCTDLGRRFHAAADV